MIIFLDLILTQGFQLSIGKRGQAAIIWRLMCLTGSMCLKVELKMYGIQNC